MDSNLPNKQKLADQFRANPTESEEAMLKLLKQVLKQLGVKIQTQLVMLGYIPDFYIKSKKLVIEIDGIVHKGRESYDRQRDGVFIMSGFNVARIPAWAVMKTPEEVKAFIRKIYKEPKPKVKGVGKIFRFQPLPPIKVVKKADKPKRKTKIKDERTESYYHFNDFLRVTEGI